MGSEEKNHGFSVSPSESSDAAIKNSTVYTSYYAQFFQRWTKVCVRFPNADNSGFEKILSKTNKAHYNMQLFDL